MGYASRGQFHTGSSHPALILKNISEQQHDSRVDRRVGRRAVVRAGVWTAPAVTVAAAAPAYAAVSGPVTTSLQLDFLSIYGADYNGAGKATTAETQTAVQNVWASNGPTLSSIVLVVSYSASWVDGAAPTLASGAGWTFSTTSRSAGAWLYTFVWSGSLPPSVSTPTLTYRVPLKSGVSGQITISATASATGVGSAAASASNNL